MNNESPAPRLPIRHNMKRRCTNHDYRSRCMYMVTLVVEGRRPLLGTLTGDPMKKKGERGCAALVPSQFGRAVVKAWKELPLRFPALRNLDLQLMPDHLHFIIFFTAVSDVTLGTVVRIFEAECRKAYRALVEAGALPPLPAYIIEEQQKALQEKRKSRCGVLFEPGFNDKILWREGELQAWQQYLADNPRRRLLKASRKDLFTVKHHLKAAGFTFDAMGNEFLLGYPRRICVQCSRRLTDADIAPLLTTLEPDFRQGSVFVSAAISPGEKVVMGKAYEQGCPVIILRENGFGQYEKPGGRAFDACARGLMLMLSPWDYHAGKTPITRDQCHMLNMMARQLSNCNMPDTSTL